LSNSSHCTYDVKNILGINDLWADIPISEYPRVYLLGRSAFLVEQKTIPVLPETRAAFLCRGHLWHHSGRWRCF
jgi:hypothetical protein